MKLAQKIIEAIQENRFMEVLYRWNSICDPTVITSLPNLHQNGVIDALLNAINNI
jgi:hypothetical protein